MDIVANAVLSYLHHYAQLFIPQHIIMHTVLYVKASSHDLFSRIQLLDPILSFFQNESRKAILKLLTGSNP